MKNGSSIYSTGPGLYFIVSCTCLGGQRVITGTSVSGINSAVYVQGSVKYANAAGVRLASGSEYYGVAAFKINIPS